MNLAPPPRSLFRIHLSVIIAPNRVRYQPHRKKVICRGSFATLVIPVLNQIIYQQLAETIKLVSHHDGTVFLVTTISVFIAILLQFQTFLTQKRSPLGGSNSERSQ